MFLYFYDVERDTSWPQKIRGQPKGDALFTVYACQALQTLAKVDPEEDGVLDYPITLPEGRLDPWMDVESLHLW